MWARLAHTRGVATKARHLKTPVQLWIADNRKRLNLSSLDLAKLTGVTEDTARGWESRGRPSEDALAILARTFGQPAPDAPSVQVEDQSALIAAIADLVAEMRLTREEQARWNRGVEETLAAVLQARKPATPTVDRGLRRRAGAPR